MRECLFIWVPKCAGTSIFSVLEGHGCLILKTTGAAAKFRNWGSVTFGHMGLKEVTERGFVTRKYLDGAFKFAFVRNPWDRMVSLWSYLKMIGRLRKDVTFEEFVSKVAAGVPPVGPYNSRALSQARPMSDWLFDGDGEPLVDFVGRVERREDFARLGELLGIRGGFPVLNASRHGEYREYYTPETRVRVSELYRGDIETFGYEF